MREVYRFQVNLTDNRKTKFNQFVIYAIVCQYFRYFTHPSLLTFDSYLNFGVIVHSSIHPSQYSIPYIKKNNKWNNFIDMLNHTCVNVSLAKRKYIYIQVRNHHKRIYCAYTSQRMPVYIITEDTFFFNEVLCALRNTIHS